MSSISVSQEVQGDSIPDSHSSSSKTVNRIVKDYGILSDLKKFPIPDSVAIEANKIYKELNLQSRKGLRKNYVYFYCIHYAYKRLGIPRTPTILARRLNLNVSLLTKAIGMFPPVEGTESFTSFIDIIPGYCEEIGIDQNSAEGIKEFARRLNNVSNTLEDQFPQNIAVGVIHFYLNIHGADIDMTRFCDQVNLSRTSILNATKYISEIYNKM